MLTREWCRRNIKYLRFILNTLGESFKSIWPLMIVWFLFMLIFGLLSMNLLGSMFKFIKTDWPRYNYDSFLPGPLGQGAFLTVFQTITVENWQVMLYNSATAGGQQGMLVHHGALVLLPIIVVLFGNYIVMNLFISILLQGFAGGVDDFLIDAAPARPDLALHPATPLPRHKRMLHVFSRILGRDVVHVAAAEEHRGRDAAHDLQERERKRESEIARCEAAVKIQTRQRGVRDRGRVQRENSLGVLPGQLRLLRPATAGLAAALERKETGARPASADLAQVAAAPATAGIAASTSFNTSFASCCCLLLALLLPCRSCRRTRKK